MNATENAALDAVLAECERILELDAKAHPFLSHEHRAEVDANFCFNSRTLTPKLARALKLAIPTLRAIIQTQEGVLWIHGRPSPDVIAETNLRAIIDLWTNK